MTFRRYLKVDNQPRNHLRKGVLKFLLLLYLPFPLTHCMYFYCWESFCMKTMNVGSWELLSHCSQKRYHFKFTLNQCLTYNAMLSQELEQQATK